MKKNELLYRAIGDINDKTAADAYESGGENSGRGQRVRTVLSVAAAVIAVAGLFVFSMFLLTYTVWNKNTDKGPVTGKTEDTADNMQITVADDVTGDEPKYSESGEQFEAVVEHPTLEELYELETYAELLPAYFPEGFEVVSITRYLPGSYQNAAGGTEVILESCTLYLENKAQAKDEDGKKYDGISVTVRKRTDEDKSIKSADTVSADGIRTLIYEDPYGDRSVKLMMKYVTTFAADEWVYAFEYSKLLCNDGDRSVPVTVEASDYNAVQQAPGLSVGEVFDLITSAPYFRTHPVNNGYEEEKPYFEKDFDGVTVSVQFDSDSCSFDSLINVTAKIQNNTDHDITVYRPVDSERSHTEINVDIFRPDSTNVRLKDIDTYGVEFNDAISYMTVKAGQTYVQNMRFTGNREVFGSRGGVEARGDYKVAVCVVLAEGDNDAAEILSFDFEITLGIPKMAEDVIRYQVNQTLDLTHFDASSIEGAEIVSGTTGENRVFTGDQLKKIWSCMSDLKGTDPVSSRGQYGFYYSVRLYDRLGTVITFTLAPDGNILCSDYEYNHGHIYKAMYKATDENAFNNLKTCIDKMFE